MKFTIRAAALAVATATSFSSMAAVDIYGKANVTVQASDEGDGSFTEVRSNASRIGFKGAHKFDDNLEAFIKIEFQVDIDGDSSDDNLKQRAQYVGLRGSFGEVVLGKADTFLKQSQGKVDLFNDYLSDLNSLWKGENRLGDTIAYKSPKFSGFQIGVSYIAEDSVDADGGVSAAVFYGDKGLKKTPIYASVAIDSEVKGYDIERASIQGKMGQVTLGAIVHHQEKLSSGAEMDGYVFSAKYSLDKWDLKAQYQAADHDGGDDQSGVSVGADYKYAKNLKFTGFYSTFDMDSEADEDYLAVGVEYKF